METSSFLVLAPAIKAGALTTHQLTTRDRSSGELVTTSWSSPIYRGVDLDGADISVDEPPAAPVEASDSLSYQAVQRTILIAREAPHVHSECAESWNPI